VETFIEIKHMFRYSTAFDEFSHDDPLLYDWAAIKTSDAYEAIQFLQSMSFCRQKSIDTVFQLELDDSTIKVYPYCKDRLLVTTILCSRTPLYSLIHPRDLRDYVHESCHMHKQFSAAIEILESRSEILARRGIEDTPPPRRKFLGIW